jgi:hypothetical protein
VSKPLLPAPKWAMPTDIPFGSDTMIESVIDDLSKKGGRRRAGSIRGDSSLIGGIC